MNRPTHQRTSHRAFTLVEMLIAMVLTLILVTSIAQFYAIVGDSVKDGRAMIELGGQMRAAVERLKTDFDLITVSVVPWTDDGSASGYFEYFEGRGYDCNANGNFQTASPFAPIFDATEDQLNANGAFVAAGDGNYDLLQLGITNTIGDGDDFIGFTIRASGQPFTGRYTYPIAAGPSVIYTSQLAEVVWWVGFDDIIPITPSGLTSGNNIWDFNEPRQLYRRQLLIRPDLTGIDNNTSYSTYQLAYAQLLKMWQENDISLSVRAEFDSMNNIVYRIRPNSLTDLTKREYRFAHMPLNIVSSGTNPPYLQDRNFPHQPLLVPSFSAKSGGVIGGVQSSFVLQQLTTVSGGSPGEDVVLSNLLAFDVQVYDPYARVWPDNPGALATSTTALVPSDPGYSLAAAAGTPATLLGLGAFVDLNYHRYLTAAAVTMDTTLSNPATSNLTFPYYAGVPSVPTNLSAAAATTYRTNFGILTYPFGATYDTWSLSYERDGVDQLGNGNFDQQTNGLDDLDPTTGTYLNGVDDVSERETVPPYSQPLRGLQVKIRLYEPSTRQVRQATVATDFITE